MRRTSDDYRYFPDPDLPPLNVATTWLADLRATLPEFPAARRARYESALGLSAYDARVLAADPDATALFESTLAADPSLAAKSVANWVTGEYLRLRNAATEGAPVSVAAAELAATIRAVESGEISRANGKEVLDIHATTGSAAAEVIAERGFRQIRDAGAIDAAVDVAIAAHPAAVADYRAGKQQSVGFLVGQVMKATRGQADAAVVQATIRERLDAQS